MGLTKCLHALLVQKKMLPFQAKLKLRNISCLVLVVLLCIVFITQYWPTTTSTLSLSHPIVQLKLMDLSRADRWQKTNCRFHMCFDINRCVLSRDDAIGVHIGEWYRFQGPQTPGPVLPEVSVEYLELVEAVKESRYHVKDPSKACAFIPPLDTLSRDSVEVNTMSVLLNSLPQWQDGENYLLFNMLPGKAPGFNGTPDYYYGKSMLAVAGFAPSSYRSGFDVSIPVYNPMTRSEPLFEKAFTSNRPRLLTIITRGEFSQSRHIGWHELLFLQTICPNIPVNQLPRRRCGYKNDRTYPFPEVLLSSRFCLLASDIGLRALDFTDVMMTGCIPVLTGDEILPFSEVLDWTLASIMCLSCDLDEVVAKLQTIPKEMVVEWRKQVLFLYKNHFSSIARIAMTTMDVINERVFPISVKNYDWWNKGYEVSHTARELAFLRPSEDEGFTAVILTYNRVKRLFEVIENVAKAPSCVRIMVIWNKVDMVPPPASNWPKIKQPIEVIRSKKNKLSNRFYPYRNLTSAVFSVDDDITMLTVDELEFGYKAWQEFPNRIVGFPSRVHIKMEDGASFREGGGEGVAGHVTGQHYWKYESQWLNNISLVLTGAAFYHKYYHYLYTYEMPAEIREWVDTHMNCEDIAMNFLVSNHTDLPPLKVSPRKKFACPQCMPEDSLWNDPEHYKERDECINIFTMFFGGMPLKAVKFRLDPILYKTDVGRDIQAYPDMGEL